MGSNRFNKPTPQPVDYRPAKKVVEEVILNLKPCLKCGKAVTTGYYAHIDGGGLCSKKCNDTYVKQGDGHENAVPVFAFNGPVFQPR